MKLSNLSAPPASDCFICLTEITEEKPGLW